jgi:rsbT co-antagonist protein RsbR
VAENLEADVLLRILNRLPSVPWASRIDLTTMTAQWIYVSPRMAELYGMTEAEMRSDPYSLMNRLDLEDAARLEQMMMSSIQTLAPTSWTGKVPHPSGEIRWIEMQIAYERDSDGSILNYGQIFDVTERKRSEELHRAVIDALPAGVMAMTLDGKFPIYNRASTEFGPRLPEDPQGRLLGIQGVFRTDGATLFPNEELPLLRAIQGEEAPEAEMILRDGVRDEMWIHVRGTPIRDEAGKIIAGVVIFHDITAQRALDRELRTSNEQLARSEQEKTALIERLRYSIDELSYPILAIWDDVLAMPIIGIMDGQRAADMVQRLLAEVARTQANFVIIDLTGVEIVDTRLATGLIKLVRKVELLGARCVLTGIRPAVAETIVDDIDVDFSRITTLRNLEHGLREALRSARREREGPRESDLDDARTEEPPAQTDARRHSR